MIRLNYTNTMGTAGSFADETEAIKTNFQVCGRAGCKACPDRRATKSVGRQKISLRNRKKAVFGGEENVEAGRK